MSTRIPVYLDCDTGVDDAVALAYLLRSDAVDLVGIGTVSGNIDSAQAARNTLDLLELAGHPDIPVAIGAHDHVTHPYGGGAKHVHGENGIGGVELPRAAAEPDARDAVQLLIDLSHAHAGMLQVLTIGPVTNIAHALERDPSLPSRIAGVTAMGGAALAQGNITPVAEANIYNDPEAADVMLRADWDTVLVPLDITMQHTLHDGDRERLLASNDPFVRAVGEILDHYLDFYVEEFGERLSPLHDPLAAMAVAGAAGIGRPLRVPVEIDTTQGPGRGQTVVDMRGQRRGPRDHAGVRTLVLFDGEESLAEDLMATLLRGA
ncbi:nucleoside hydrolase [Microbacterium sediminicola]|uniref:Nucleoside hydrolase n=1 Tax=Microbacterium sediminicola TaxID=415210 RepID=A0ABN2ICC1_9MICO